MSWQSQPSILLLLLAAVISAVIAIMAWLRRPAPGATPLFLMMVGAGWWALAYGLELASPELSFKIFWGKSAHLGIVTIPLAWLVLVLHVTGRVTLLTRRNLLLLALIPFSTLILAWTTDIHGLVYREFALDVSGGFPVLTERYGPWFWVFAVYSYLLTMAGAFLLFQQWLRAPDPYRKQAIILLCSGALPWMANVLNLTNFRFAPYLDLTPFAFVLTGLISAWALLRHRLLDLVPVARDTLVESMDDMMLVLDDRNRVVDLNEAFSRFVGSSASELIGRSAAEVLPEWPKLRNHFDATGTAETIMLETKGDQRCFDLRVSQLHKVGHFAGRLIVLRDITEYKQTQEQAERREQAYRTLVENTPDMIARFDSECRHIYVNPAVEVELGVSSQEFLGKTHRELGLPLDLVTKSERIIRSIFETGQEQLFETTVPTKSGMKYYLSRGVPEYAEDNTIESTLFIHRNVTEHKQAEATLRESEEKFRTLAEQSPNMIFINQGGRVVYANDCSEQTLGFSKQEFYSTDFDFLSLIAPEDREKIRAHFAQHLRGEEVDPYDYTLVTKDGQRLEAIITTKLIEYEGVQSILGVVTDITERKRIEAEIRRRTTELEAVRQLGLDITAELDLDSVLHSIASRAIELLGGISGGLYLYRPERDVIEWMVAIGPNLASIGSILKRGEGLSGKVWESGEPLIIDNYSDWEGRAGTYQAFSFAAVMAVPIRWGEEFLGVLNVLRDEPGAFSQVDAELLNLFATQAAIAIKNAQLVQALRTQWELAESLANAAAVVNSTLHIDEVLDHILKQVERVVAGDTFNVMLVEGEYARIVRARGYDRMGIKEPIPDSPFPIAQYPNLMSMIQTGESIVITDTAADSDWIARKDREWRHAYVGAPIRIGGSVVGFLNANGTRAGQFDPADGQRLSAFADHAATAIENARLVEGLEDTVAARTAEIQIEKEKSETILRSIGDAIVMSDLDLRVQYVNDAFLSLTGYTKNDVMGKHVNTVGPIIESKQTQEFMKAELAKGRQWQDAVVAHRKDGRTYDAILTIAPVLDAKGNLTGYVSSHRDISQQKRLDRAREQFLTNLSHQLRTPLTNISLYTYLLRQTSGMKEKNDQYLRILEEQADRLKSLIQDILQMTTLDSGKVLGNWAPIKFPTLIRDALMDFKDKATAAGLELQAHPLPTKLPAVMGDSIRLAQALAELLENAIAFTPAGGQITLAIETTFEDEQPWLKIAVRDTGLGIAPEEQELVFDRFYRGKPAETGDILGTGLGLSIVDVIMQAHGGRVTVESVLGQGSTFALWLREQQSDV